jgi:predicted alpha/beta superfamily hydrolase
MQGYIFLCDGMTYEISMARTEKEAIENIYELDGHVDRVILINVDEGTASDYTRHIFEATTKDFFERQGGGSLEYCNFPTYLNDYRDCVRR